MRNLLLVFLAAASLPVAAQSMEPGEWEFRTVMTSSVVKAPQERTVVQCVTPEDARDPTRFTARNETAGCNVTPGTRTASSYEWTVQCDQGMRGAGKARFAGRALESEMRMSVDLQGVKMEINAETKGRLLGPCK